MAERIAEWVEQLEAGEAETRRRAAEQLARSSQIQEALIPLVRAAGDSDDQVREWVAAGLEEAGAPDREELASLLHLLADPQTDVSYWAATLIGRMGSDARDAGDPLAEALATHPAMAVRQRAAWALGKVGASTPLARQRLREASRGDDARLARLAQRALDE